MQSSNLRTAPYFRQLIKEIRGKKRDGKNKEKKAVNDNNSLIMKLKIRMKLTTQKT